MLTINDVVSSVAPSGAIERSDAYVLISTIAHTGPDNANSDKSFRIHIMFLLTDNTLHAAYGFGIEMG